MEWLTLFSNLNMKKNIVLTLVVMILFINIISASPVKTYDSVNKIVSLKDNGEEQVTAQLIYNTYHCANDCEALLKIQTKKPIQTVINSIEFQDLKNNRYKKTLSYNWYLQSGDSWISLDEPSLNSQINKTGTYYVKLIGKKNKNDVIDWIPTFLGIQLNEWAIWGQTNVYDEFADTTVNLSLWRNTTGGTCTFRLTENTDYMEVNVSGTGDGSDLVETTNFTDISNLYNLTFKIDLKAVTVAGGGNAADAFVSLFDYSTQIDTLHVGDTGGTLTSSHVWNLIRNLSRDDNSFILYRDGAYNSSFYNVGQNGEGYILRITTSKSGSASGYADGKIYYVYYVTGNTSMNYTYQSPVNDYSQLSNVPIDFNVTVNVTDNTLVNTSLYINAVYNETKNFTGTMNSTSFTKTFPGYNNYTWFFRTCDSNNNCKNGDLRRLNITRYLLNSYINNVTTILGENESFIYDINYSSAEFTTVIANLTYNGTTYTTTKTNTLNGATFSKTLTTTTPIGNKSVSWQIYMTNTTGTTVVLNSSNSSQYVYNITFGYCSAAQLYPYMKFTFKDENNLTDLNVSNDLSTWYINDNALIFILSNITVNNNYSFCFTPTDRNITAKLEYFQYSASGYPQRSYYFSGSLSNISTNVTLYLLSSAAGIYSTFVTTNINNQPVAGTTLQIERQFNGIWTIIAQGVTDSSGAATFWLNPNYAHRVTATKSGYGSTTVTVTPSQSIYTILMNGASNYTYAGSFDGLEWKIFPGVGIVNDSTQNFGFNITSSKANLVKCKIDLKDNASTLATAEANAIDSGNCYVSVSYTPLAYKSFKGVLSVDLGSGYQVLEGDSFWINENVTTMGGTLKDFFNDLKNFNTSYFGDSENHKEYTMIVLFFFFVMIVCSALSTAGWDLQNRGGIVLILLFLTWMASIGGFLTLSNISPIPPLCQYFVAICVSLYVGGYLFKQFT